MLFKDTILKISKENFQRINIQKRNKTTDTLTLKSMEEMDASEFNKNLFVIIEEEDIHIKHLVVPKVDEKTLNSILSNKLYYLYGKKAEEIFYTYEKWSTRGKQIEILLYCINCEKLKELQIHKNKLKLHKVNLIQTCFIKYYLKRIKEKDYIMIFKYNKSIYFLALVDGKIIGNKFLKSYNNEQISNALSFIMNKLKNYREWMSNIYYANLEENTINQIKEFQEENKLINLGNLTEQQILGYYILNRRR